VKDADDDLMGTADERAGWNALHYTAYGGFTNAATALIEHGCILSSSGSDGQTTFSLSLTNEHKATARLISGSDGLDIALERGCMHLAAKAGNDAAVRNLVNAKCDPFTHDDAERGPLLRCY
jgi:ankyrin repeat protein